MVALSVKDLCVSHDRTSVLKGVDLDVRKGEVTSILGESGSGKTTLLKAIDLLVRPYSGELSLDGTVYWRGTEPVIPPEAIRRKIGFVFQELNLLPNLNVRRNIRLRQEVASNDSAFLRPDDVAEALGIGHLQDRFPDELSGGEAQRVAIARALIPTPSLLLLDEITSSLDSSNIEKLASLLKEVRRLIPDITMITVTHSRTFAKTISTDIRKLENGELSIIES